MTQTLQASTMQEGGKRGGAECAGPRLGHCPSPEFDSGERRRRSAVAWSIFARLLPAAQRERSKDLAVSARRQRASLYTTQSQSMSLRLLLMIERLLPRIISILLHDKIASHPRGLTLLTDFEKEKHNTKTRELSSNDNPARNTVHVNVGKQVEQKIFIWVIVADAHQTA